MREKVRVRVRARARERESGESESGSERTKESERERPLMSVTLDTYHFERSVTNTGRKSQKKRGKKHKKLSNM